MKFLRYRLKLIRLREHYVDWWDTYFHSIEAWNDRTDSKYYLLKKDLKWIFFHLCAPLHILNERESIAKQRYRITGISRRTTRGYPLNYLNKYVYLEGEGYAPDPPKPAFIVDPERVCK